MHHALDPLVDEFAAPLHGGADALGLAQHDFSSNANACGPCPLAQRALARADRTHYPDPAYGALRAALAAFHRVDAARIVLAASASEFIFRVSAHAARSGLRRVALPAHGYGDYARAAHAWALHAGAGATSAGAALRWACEPASPLGGEDAQLSAWRQGGVPESGLCVLDCAYAPLRLQGATIAPQGVWQLWTPNKALGLTGVRAAYAIAPAGRADAAAALNALASSWQLGADGVALLSTWVQPQVQQWLARSLDTLRQWRAEQSALCAALGWQQVPGSVANFFSARLPLPESELPALLQALRAHGVKLRDAASFGLPGHVRVAVRPAASQQALARAWRQCAP